MNAEQRAKLYREAMRYIDKASKMLSEKGKKKEGLYQDIKCVRVACRTAYSGLLLATKCYLEMKGQPIVKKKGRHLTLEQYKENLAKVDSKALNYFNNAYNLLYLDGYCDGLNSVIALKGGFDEAMEIFKRIAPREMRPTAALD